MNTRILSAAVQAGLSFRVHCQYFQHTKVHFEPKYIIQQYF